MYETVGRTQKDHELVRCQAEFLTSAKYLATVGRKHLFKVYMIFYFCNNVSHLPLKLDSVYNINEICHEIKNDSAWLYIMS